MTVGNDPPEDTTLHWHGMHLPARHGGGPGQPIASGASWQPEWDVDQPASTLWYHPHGRTAEHVYRGVAGMIALDDETDALPREYGGDDIPLIIQDRVFDDDGQLDLDTGSFLDAFDGSPAFGICGDTIPANGTRGSGPRATPAADRRAGGPGPSRAGPGHRRPRSTVTCRRHPEWCVQRTTSRRGGPGGRTAAASGGGRVASSGRHRRPCPRRHAGHPPERRKRWCHPAERLSS